jgi:hypothetical protein
VRARLAVLSFVIIGCLAVIVVEANHQYEMWSCAASAPAPPCPAPPTWVWADVVPAHVLLGGIVAGLIAICLQKLARRERHRRRSWGEL